MENKLTKIIGTMASIVGICMYVSYIAQIQNNLSGAKGHFLQPLVACITSALWLSYGFFKKQKDIPVIIASVPGILFGFIAFITSL